MRHRYGVYTSENGIKYEGNWSNGTKNGNGKLYIKENLIYDGKWKNGIKQGYGRMKWKSGNIYEGNL